MVFTRPENALSRANELITVGKPHIALDTLAEVITSRRHRTWTKTHQPIMEKFLELCVLLRKSDRAKDGLYQYKNICQSVNVGSLEEVILGFLRLATKRTEDARKVSQMSTVDVDDLDSLQTPDSLILQSEQGITNAKAQQERDAYMTWLRFLWDSYRQCLDILKNNSRVEMQYKLVALGALQFALKYQRKFEFRKCCEMIRQHLQLSYKHVATMTYSIKLDNADSIKYLIDVRMCMFETAVKLDLWQEAFKAIEEIHDIMHQAKLQFTPLQYVNYYWKGSQVFWYTGYYACHAYALFRNFVVFKEQKSNATADELARYASRLVLAILSVPSYQERAQMDKAIESDLGLDRQRDVHHLLDLSQAPSRLQLLQDVEALRITAHLPNEIRQLLCALETHFDPLLIKQKVDDFMVYLETQTLDPSLIQYGPRIKDVACMRFLQQASQVYRNITYSRLQELCPVRDGTNPEVYSIVNHYIARLCRANVIEVRVNDRSQMLTFASDLSAIPIERRDFGPSIQPYPQDVIRSQLCRMGLISELVVSKTHAANMTKLSMTFRQRAVEQFRAAEARSVTAARSDRIEQLKTIQEKVVNRRKENEFLAARRLEQMKVEEERQRRDAELRRREEERKNEMKRLQDQQNLTFVLQTDFGRKELADKTPDELLKIDLKSLQLQKQEKEMKAERDKLEKLAVQGKRVDYFVRACHSEELSLVGEYALNLLRERREHRALVEREIIDTACREREMELSTQACLSRMVRRKDEFYERLFCLRRAEHSRQMEEYEARLGEERERLRVARRDRRKVERREAWRREKEEERRRIAEQKHREEIELRNRADEERKRIEEEKFRKYQEQIALQQRQEKPAAAAASSGFQGFGQSGMMRNQQRGHPKSLMTSSSATMASSRGQASGGRNFDALMQLNKEGFQRRVPSRQFQFSSMRQNNDRRRDAGYPDFRGGDQRGSQQHQATDNVGDQEMRRMWREKKPQQS